MLLFWLIWVGLLLVILEQKLQVREFAMKLIRRNWFRPNQNEIQL